MNQLSVKIVEKIPEFFDGIINYKKRNHSISIGFIIEFLVKFNEKYYIELIKINKSKNYSGSLILNSLEKLFLNFQEIKYITLKDTSEIYIRNSKNNIFQQSLSLIYIMSSGVTWFNKFGYYQETFGVDMILYNKIIDRNFFDLIDSIISEKYILGNREINYLYINLLQTYKLIIIDSKIVSKKVIIDTCMYFLKYHLPVFMIDKYDTIRDIGFWFKNTKDFNDDSILYLKNIILTLFSMIVKFQWDENFNFIKWLK